MNRERENAKIELNGSPESRAIARALAQQRTAKPKLSQYDEDAHLIYGRISCMGYDLVPSSWDIRHTPVYARGMEVSNMLCGPIIPAHLDEHLKRFTRASGEFEFCFGREPVVGDILHFHQLALVHHPDIIEMKTSLFVQAWERRLGELPCPLKFENGRLFKRVTRGRPGSTPEWIEDISVQPQAIWREIERHIKWLALGKPNGLRLGPLDLSLDEIPTIPALTFEGVGPREQYGGIVENRHRCRPATEEEMQRPEIEPPKGSVLALLQKALVRSENPKKSDPASG